MMGMFIAVWVKVFFRKYHYNIFEIITMLCYVMGLGMIIFALFAALEGISHVPLMQVSGILGFIYCAWAIGQFFDKGKIMNYVKAFFAYVLGFITFSVAALLLGAAIDLLIKH